MRSRRDKARKAAPIAAAGLGSALGGAAGLASVNAVPERIKARMLANLIADRPIIIGGTMSPELMSGSGEAQMAKNITRLLRRNGINARFGLSGGGESGWIQQDYAMPSYMDRFSQRAEPWWSKGLYLQPGSHIDHRNLLKLNAMDTPGGTKAGDHLLTRMLESSGPEGKQWLRDHSGPERLSLFRELLSGKRTGLGISDFDKGLARLRSGEWDRFSPGRLTTLLKLDGSLRPMLEDGAEMYMLPGEIKSRIASGRAAGLLSTERGFYGWSSPAFHNPLSAASAFEFAVRELPISQKAKEGILAKVLSKRYGFTEKGFRDMMEMLKENGFDLSGSMLHKGSRGAITQLLSESVGPNSGVKNLGLLYNFKANYSSPGDAYIPGADIPDPPNTIAEALSGKRESRAKLIDAINEARRAEGAPPIGKNGRIVFMSGGSAGPNGTQKLIDMLKATEGMDDVHIFDQIGGNPDFVDYVRNTESHRGKMSRMSEAERKAYIDKLNSAGNNYVSDLAGEYAELKRKYPGKFTVVSRLPKASLKHMIAGADLYAPYGGSSTAQEASAFLTPQAFTTDDMLNRGNLEFIVDKSRTPLVTNLNNTSTAIARHVPKMDGSMSSEDIADMLKNKYRLGIREGLELDGEKRLRQIGGIHDEVARALRGDVSAAESASASNAEKIRRLLSPESQREAYSDANLARLKNFVSDQRNATDRFVAAARKLMDGAVERTDAGLRFGLGPRGITNGLKGAYLRLGRMLAKGPVNSRLAPALAGAGAIGGGVGSYLLGRKLTED